MNNTAEKPQLHLQNVISWAFDKPKKADRYLVYDDMGWIGYRSFDGNNWEYHHRCNVLAHAKINPPCI